MSSSRALAALWTAVALASMPACSSGGGRAERVVVAAPPPHPVGPAHQPPAQPSARPANHVGAASPGGPPAQPPATDIKRDRDTRLKAVQQGWTQDQVVAHVGPPDSVQGGTWWYKWEEPNGGWYSRWRLVFDAAGRLTYIRQFVGEVVPF